MFAVRFIRGRIPQGVDEEDLEWETIRETPYATWSAADDAARDYDASFDGQYTHQVIELREHFPELAKTASAPFSPALNTQERRRA
jgi:hypothetical protein